MLQFIYWEKKIEHLAFWQSSFAYIYIPPRTHTHTHTQPCLSLNLSGVDHRALFSSLSPCSLLHSSVTIPLPFALRKSSGSPAPLFTETGSSSDTNPRNTNDNNPQVKLHLSVLIFSPAKTQAGPHRMRIVRSSYFSFFQKRVKRCFAAVGQWRQAPLPFSRPPPPAPASTEVHCPRGCLCATVGLRF